MASIKIVLRKKKNKDGTYPLALRITKDRKSSFVHLGHSITEKQWDDENNRVRKSHPNSRRLNNYLIKKLSEAEDDLLTLEAGKKDTSSATIKNKIRASKGSSFFAQAAVFLKEIEKQGKYNRHKSDCSRVASFKTFLNDTDIAFEDVTTQLILRYRAYLKGSKKLSEQTIVNNLTIIQTIFNYAIRNGIVDQKYYPFGKEKIRLKAPRSLKIGLTPEEIQSMEELDLPTDGYAHHARNVWLFAFYFAGMRASDVLRLKWQDFQNDRLYYAMGKNDKAGSLKIPGKAAAILAEYKRPAPVHDLVFPNLETVPDMNDTYAVQKRISHEIQKLNTALREVRAKVHITKQLTMHIARHSFGNISGDKIPIQMLQKLYRHTSITTTIGYQANFIHKDADEALDAVIGF